MEQTVLAAPSEATSRPVSPSEDIAQLCAILRVVEELAGNAGARGEPELACLDARHAAAAGVVRARYARLAERTARFSAAGVSALIGTPAGHEPARRAAAEYLAGEMRHAIDGMTRVLAR